MWRCSGACRSTRLFFGVNRGLCFDSPHLHTPPGVSLRFRGFRCPHTVFRPSPHSLPCIRM
nr:MAG TPA: Urease subunit alpha [Caudoviricetes sp.]